MSQEELEYLRLKKQKAMAMRTPEPTPMQPMQEQVPQDPGFMERVGTDLEQRKRAVLEAKDPVVGIIESARLGVGGASDIGYEALKSGYGMIPESIRGPIEEAGRAVAPKLGAVARAVGDVGSYLPGMETYRESVKEQAPKIQEYLAESPRLKSALGYVSELPLGAGTAKAATTATKLAPIGRNIGKGITSKTDKQLLEKTKALLTKSQYTIEKEVKSSGLTYTPAQGGKLINRIEGIGDFKTAGEAANLPNIKAILKGSKEDIGFKDSLLGPALKNKKGKAILDATGNPVRDVSKADMSLRNLLGWKKKFDRIARKVDTESAVSNKILTMINNTIFKGEIATGSPEALAKLKKFNKQYGLYKTHETFGKMLKEHGSNPKKIRAGLQKTIDSPHFNSLDPDIQKLITKASKTTVSGRLFELVGMLENVFGHRVATMAAIGVGGMSAGISLAPLALTGGAIMGAKAAGKQIQRGLVTDVLSAIEKAK